MRVTPSMLEELKQQDNWQDLVREAIAEKLSQGKTKHFEPLTPKAHG